MLSCCAYYTTLIMLVDLDSQLFLLISIIVLLIAIALILKCQMFLVLGVFQYSSLLPCILWSQNSENFFHISPNVLFAANCFQQQNYSTSQCCFVHYIFIYNSLYFLFLGHSCCPCGSSFGAISISVPKSMDKV